MEITLNQQAINLAALFFVRGGVSMESGLHDGEIQALHVLKQAKAVVPGQINARDAMCAFCGLYRGSIFRNDDGLMVQCPDCGPFRLDPASQRSWQLDDEWLIRRLRGALDIASHSAASPIVDGVWDIGRYKKRPVVLARRIDLVERHGLRIFHGSEPRNQSWVITPRPLGRMTQDPLEGTATWWRLEDRFALHGMALRLLGDEPEDKVDSYGKVIPVAVHGPFSHDFAWVHLEQGDSDGCTRAVQSRLRLGSFGELAAWPHPFNRGSSQIVCCSLGVQAPSSVSGISDEAGKSGQR